ncbi:MAG TPA: type II toxin-antitoxin system VapC family toxin [Anaerolineales bacterium]|nr:type II toxin-antitoxin system VapC family toxin [Anaerolineales bacterium]
MSYWVIDANIVVHTVLDITDRLARFWERVGEEQITPCAPRLWLSETASAIRFLLSQKEITSEEAEQALRTIHGLRVEIIDEDEELSLRALELAGKLGQSKAFDAFYLAMAEELAAEFWTADERLASRCRKDLKLKWVHSIAEV